MRLARRLSCESPASLNALADSICKDNFIDGIKIQDCPRIADLLRDLADIISTPSASGGAAKGE